MGPLTLNRRLIPKASSDVTKLEKVPTIFHHQSQTRQPRVLADQGSWETYSDEAGQSCNTRSPLPQAPPPASGMPAPLSTRTPRVGVLPDFSGSQSPGGGAGLGGAGRRELRGGQGARCKQGRGGQSSSRLASAMVFTRGSQERLSWALAYLFSTLFLQILFRESSGTPVIHFLGPENPQPLSTCQLSGEKSGEGEA